MSLRDKISEYTQGVRNKKANIGVFAVGHYLYWPQFPALKDKLMKHYEYFCRTLAEKTNANIVNCEIMSDDSMTGMQVADFFEREPLD